MKKWLVTIIWTVTWVFFSTMAMGNPAMLPSHPGYPMGNAKDPVTGLSLANDPGQSPLSSQESISEASKFHDSAVVNPMNDQLPNVVHTEGASTKKTQEKGGNPR